jgi:hypothetical protein
VLRIVGGIVGMRLEAKRQQAEAGKRKISNLKYLKSEIEDFKY